MYDVTLCFEFWGMPFVMNGDSLPLNNSAQLSPDLK